MQITVLLMLIGWPIVSLILFLAMPPRKAVTASLFAGWLVLPQAKIQLTGLPDYTRTTAVVVGIVLGILIFDYGRILSIRLKLFDIPAVVLCLSPFFSSLSNGLGYYDGISAVVTSLTWYGIPYLIGRIYFCDQVGMHKLATGLAIAMLFYIPLILFEIRMSPQFHKHVYGFHQIPYHMMWRLGWYRPMVFLRHGLELGGLLSAATLTAIWLWRTRSASKFGWLPAGFASLALLIVCLLCRALNGYIVLILGLGALYLGTFFKARLVLVLLIMLPQVYVFGRISTNWDAAPLVEVVQLIDQDRARSLQSRISHEITLIDKALQRPLLGWSGYNRNRADDLAAGAMGHRSITDSFWIIIFGKYGLIGLLSTGMVLLLPTALLTRRLPIANWSNPVYAPASALSLVMLGFTIDCLANAMISPIYFLISGALIAYQPVKTRFVIINSGICASQS